MSELAAASELATGDGVPSTSIPLISDEAELLSRGVVFCDCIPLPPSSEQCYNLMPGMQLEDLTEVSPFNIAQEDDSYAFYKNIKEDNITDEGATLPTATFPVDMVMKACGPVLLKYFVDDLDEVYLDDIFVVHYNTDQFDSRCAKHQDPSDITINVCLESSQDLSGSQIVFYGERSLKGVGDGTKKESGKGDDVLFKVDCKLGACTLHWGGHPHETLPLGVGRRTNVVLTLAYKDKGKSGKNRTCYM
jgi:hypothetical protein